MTFLITFLPYIQIALAALITVAVLLQQADTSLGGAFGAGDTANGSRTRRGGEQFLFVGTIIMSMIFVATCLVALMV